MKKCRICLVVKESSEFYKNKACKGGLFNECKVCTLIAQNKYNNSNKDLRKKRSSRYYLANKEYILKRNKEWANNNPLEMKKNMAAYRKRKKDSGAKNVYYENNKQKIRDAQRKYSKKRRENDSLYRLKIYIRNRIKQKIKREDMCGKSSIEFLGTDIVTAKTHIERQFKKGMSWSNHGEWHIDHIIPLSSAKTKEDLINLFHYKNLQPLWAKENLTKHAKITKSQTFLPI